ncbi:hypothetical protein K8I61_03505 [bacterium]|nr:hypothetical protein [bacterium]
MRDQRTTSLIDIRDFLRAHDAAPPPWESADAVVEHLFVLLRERADDDAFWRDLKMLLARLEDRRFDSTALANASALGVTNLDAVIDRLRAELGTLNGSPSGVRAFFAGPLGGAAILGFLLMATSYSCFSGDGDGDGTNDVSDDDAFPADDDANDDDAFTNKDCERADWYDYTGREADVFCELVAIVERAEISSSDRSDILACLPDLGGAYREELLDAFQDMSDERLADYLEGMLQYGGECYEEQDWWDDDH